MGDVTVELFVGVETLTLTDANALAERSSATKNGLHKFKFISPVKLLQPLIGRRTLFVLSRE